MDTLGVVPEAVVRAIAVALENGITVEFTPATAMDGMHRAIAYYTDNKERTPSGLSLNPLFAVNAAIDALFAGIPDVRPVTTYQ